MTSDEKLRRLEELKERYAAERDKRLRDDGNNQYLGFEELERQFDHDPFADPDFTRDALEEECEVAIIGAGMGGLMTGARLMERGIKDIRIIDKAADFGGTWYWNRYPGAACDVESYCYMPFLEETGYMPTEKYAKAPEIFAHCQRIGRHFNLYDRSLFQTLVSELRWLDDENRWLVTTNRGDKIKARFVTIAGGIMHKAKLPGIPGVETFGGHSFHTTRWDYGFTGGSPTERMEKLKDKKVAIIGTGATAIQAVPRLAQDCEQLYVVQRTPSAVGPRDNGPTDEEWFKSLEPGWQRKRMQNFTRMVSSEEVEQDLVQDGWTNIFKHIPNAYAASSEEQQLADMEQMDKVRARVDAIIEDEETAEGLKPWYAMMCKRPCFHDEYLQSFNQENVTLVDTKGHGVDAIDETGLTVGGQHYDVDCIIYSTGFEISTFYVRRLGFEIYGRNGVSMSEDWGKQTGPHTLHGIHSHGFPNMFMFSLVQGGQTVNFVHLLTELAIHVAEIVKQCDAEGIEVIEATEEGEAQWWQKIMEFLMVSAEFRANCTPSYMNAEGRPDPSMIKIATYNGSMTSYGKILEDWRAEGDMPGLAKFKASEDA
ncbi:flavin-containing monooxygenase [Erythrobacter litoralis]|uniref:flavin-containing monooxygenase n=1 Tax=Erythrobacter litoralis TaxID=39960 RepID=UPI002435C563|nr:NAD(P)/FAD-dependent oxidoreductase [Erythrobacter litoralis]